MFRTITKTLRIWVGLIISVFALNLKKIKPRPVHGLAVVHVNVVEASRVDFRKSSPNLETSIIEPVFHINDAEEEERLFCRGLRSNF